MQKPNRINRTWTTITKQIDFVMPLRGRPWAKQASHTKSRDRRAVHSIPLVIMGRHVLTAASDHVQRFPCQRPSNDPGWLALQNGDREIPTSGHLVARNPCRRYFLRCPDTVEKPRSVGSPDRRCCSKSGQACVSRKCLYHPRQ